MTVPVDHPPAPPTEEQAPPAAGKPGIEDRTWLLVVTVLLFIALAFAGMIVLTALAGGTTYVR